MHWENTNFCSLSKLPLPPMTVLQVGWQEQEHNSILDIKNKISEFGSSEEWEIRKKLTNSYEAIYSGDNSFPSVCSFIPLSRSYFKMVEILKISGFWESLQSTSFLSTHICEGPGGFLQNVIETAKKRNLSIKAVYAMTLKPTRPHIPGWRRSFYFLRKHPEIKLEYGVDNTGNILVPENQKYLASQAKGSNLFTADGGFDFSVDYNKQEQNVFPLLLASFLIGLQVLQEGGTCIIKFFDIYSEVTKDLILGSASFFESFTLYKPATSRPCNSERYFIGRGYLGKTLAANWIHHLQEAQKKIQNSHIPLTRLFLTPWPLALKELINEQIKWQEILQMKSIYDTLNLQISKKDLEIIIEKNIELSMGWCKYFEMPVISCFLHQDQDGV